MKTRSHKLFVWGLLLCIFFASCNAGELNKKAEATASAFYTDLQKKDYPAALGLLSDSALIGDTKESWTRDFQRNNVLLGNIVSFTKTSDFNIATSTADGTTVVVTYDVQWQYGKSSDSVVLHKEKDGSMKVYRYEWKHKEAKYMAVLEESEKTAGQYMDDIKAGNYDSAIALCSDDALKITPRDQWKSFLDNAANKLGPVYGYSFVKDSSTYDIGAKGDSGEGNYYDIYIKSKRLGGDVVEKIICFQKDFNQPVKLVGHNFL